MEPNPKARAMEWSVELEKGLRSKNPHQRSHAISEFGPKILLWSQEPDRDRSQSVHHLFDLIPGEDRLFANASLLRLADAFRLGDHLTRVSIVKVFLAELRDRRGRNGNGGLLSKVRVSNSSELIQRVEAVFRGGDAESKALGLRLFGCWAGFAAESANVRYLVLSGLVSSHVSEAKAALFAAGCFCEVSSDFPFVVLEMLGNLMASSETPLSIRLTAARIFAKVGKSYATATRAHKLGLKLMLEFPEEDYQISLLVSLSKIGSNSCALVSDQVNFLLSFLSREKTQRVRETALTCLRFIYNKGVNQFSVNAGLVRALFSMLDEHTIPASMQCEALTILRKIVVYLHPDLLCDIDLDKLLTIAENLTLSPFDSVCSLAIYLLVDLSKRYKETDSEKACSSPIPSQAVLLIFSRITVLAKSLFGQADSVKFEDIDTLLNLLLSIIKDDQDLASIMLDRVCEFVRYLSGTIENDSMDIDTPVLRDSDGEKRKAIRLKLAYNIYRFMVTFLEFLSEAGAIGPPIFNKVKLLGRCVCESNLLDSFTRAIYSMLLYSPVIWGHGENKSDESFILEFTNKILSENRNWAAYRAGINSACHGAWFTSSFIFQHLISQVSSDSCSSWLKSLSRFAHSEKKMMLLNPTKEYSRTKLPPSILRDNLNEIDEDGTELILSAYRSICSSKETLDFGEGFCFQRWFLCLRAKTVHAMLDLSQTLNPVHYLCEENGNEDVEKGVSEKCLFSLRKVCFRLKNLSKEFDLCGSSFIDMDSRSRKVISALALSASLLAFIAGFFLFIPSIPENTSSDLKSSKNSPCAHLVQNLTGRLWQIDPETSAKLCQLIDFGKQADCFHLQLGNQAFNFGCEARDIITVCRQAVLEISCLRSEANGISDRDSSQVLNDVIKLTQKFVTQWTHIPFRAPKYFFQLRPCIGSELFAVSVPKIGDGIRTLQGYHLSLSLCLQLKNPHSDLPFRPTKLYCIIYSKVSFRDPNPTQKGDPQSKSAYRAWEDDYAVETSEKLVRYVTKCAAQNVEEAFVSACVRCEPNESGQGFASCLLDVSGFPAGFYGIKWQSCCVDEEGNCWNLLPLNAGPVFTVQ